MQLLINSLYVGVVPKRNAESKRYIVFICIHFISQGLENYVIFMNFHTLKAQDFSRSFHLHLKPLLKIRSNLFIHKCD